MITELAEIPAVIPVDIVAAIIIGIVGALGGGLATKKVMEKRLVQLHEPVPTITVREEDDFIKRVEFVSHCKSVEHSLNEVHRALDSERGVARTANGNIHQRIDKLSERLGERLSSVESKIASVGETTDKLLNIALSARKP